MGKIYFDFFLLFDFFMCFGSEKYINWVDKCVQYIYCYIIIVNGFSVFFSYVVVCKSVQDVQGIVIEIIEKGVGLFFYFDLQVIR